MGNAPGHTTDQVQYMSTSMLIGTLCVLLASVCYCNAEAFHPSMQGRGAYSQMIMSPSDTMGGGGAQPRYGNRPLAVAQGLVLTPDEVLGDTIPGNYRRGHRDYVRFGRSVTQKKVAAGGSRRKRSPQMYMSPAVWARTMDLMK